MKEGAALVKVCKRRLSEIENEFEQIQRDVEGGGTKGVSAKVAPARAKASQDSTDNTNPEEVPF